MSSLKLKLFLFIFLLIVVGSCSKDPQSHDVPGSEAKGDASTNHENTSPGSKGETNHGNITRAGREEVSDMLVALGYLAGYEPAVPHGGVTIYNEKLAFPGVTLLISAHSPEAFLIDMHGKELHRWYFDVYEAWPDFVMPTDKKRYMCWRRVHLYENGDLLAIYPGVGLIKIDKDSELIWKYRGGMHHDIDVAPDGKIYVLERVYEYNPKYNDGEPIWGDYITVISDDGVPLEKVSILKCFENSIYSPVLNRLRDECPVKAQKTGDILHTNTLELLDDQLSPKSAAFRSGNVLICILFLDLICVIDPSQEKVTWALDGFFLRPHQPTVLENDHMLLFDNMGHGGKTKVVEFDPFTQEVFWMYANSPDTPIFSGICGSNQKLPNNNILITESTGGRAFEVTRDHKIVWEYYNPNCVTMDDEEEKIALLFEAIRYGSDFNTSWLNTDSP